MTNTKLLPIPVWDYDALGITPDSVLETSVTEDGVLMVRVVDKDCRDSFICGHDCENCPLADNDNHEC